MKKNYKFFLGATFFIIFVISIFIYFERQIIRNRELIIFSDTSDIIGRVLITKLGNKMTYVKLVGEKQEYYLLARDTFRSKVVYLEDFLKKGDSIYKKKFNDSIFVLNGNGEKFLFLIDRGKKK